MTRSVVEIHDVLLTPKWQNLEITSPHPVAPLRYYLWQLAVLAMSTPLRPTLFEEYTFTPTKVIIIFPFCQTNTLSMGSSVLTTAFIAPALLDLEYDFCCGVLGFFARPI